VFSAYHFCESKKYWGDKKNTNKTTWVASQNACLSLEKYTFRQPFH
jgi:hypothetical protein